MAILTVRVDELLASLESRGIPLDSSEGSLALAARDASQLQSAPLVVVRPNSEAQISETVELCERYCIPITVAGGYTGLSGGALGYKAVRVETRQLDSFSIQDGSVRAQAGASVPEIIRQVEAQGYSFPFQPASACRTEDVYDYLGSRVGPVTIGGSLGANASGLVGCKLGAAAEWVTELLVVRPGGRMERVTQGFERYVGAEGRYGIIVEAEIAPAPPLGDIQTFLISGTDVESFTSAAVSIGRAGALPLLAEAMVMAGAPPDFESIARKTLADPDAFLDQFGPLFRPNAWLIMLQGSHEDVDVCLRGARTSCDGIEIRQLADREFVQMKQIRSAASDEIGRGIENPDRGPGVSHPVQRASRFLAEAIRRFQERGMRPKAEHNLGMLRTFLEGEETRDAYRRDIASREAFDDGSLRIYEECGGDLGEFFARFLSPKVTEEMVRQKIAVNFPGNEDILVRAEQFPETVNLLDSMMRKYGACPVPLYYCHINFRKSPGWILLHNRLLIDVAEFD